MIRLYLLVGAVSIAVLYGSTYQPFRFFSLADPGGAMDALLYVDMTRGVLPITPESHHYRWVTPALARLALPIARQLSADDELSIRLAFYLVNFAFSLVTCLVLFRLLQLARYSALLSMLGVCAFASSRVTAFVTATPLVDAAYFCAIAIVIWLTVEKKALALAFAMPFLILVKEPVMLFVLLPLLTDLRKRRAIWVGLAVATVTFVISRRVVEGYYAGHDAALTDATLMHIFEVGPVAARRLFGPSGVHDFQNGFSLLLPLSAIGAWLNARHRYHEIPVVVVATLPMAFGLALLSGNLGRMFFAAFPAVIAYALIAVEHVARVNDPR